LFSAASYTFPEGVLNAAYTRLPSGLRRTPRGRAPTPMVENTSSVAVSMTVIVPSRSFVT
jgi:hypothetical protein